MSGEGLAGGLGQARKGRWIARWAPVLCYVALILAVSSIPRLRPPGGLPEADKFAHLAEYGILGMLLRRAVALPGRRGWLVVVLVAAAIGGIDETYQSMVPGRVRSLTDLMADTAGAGIGAAVQPVLAAWLRGRGQGRGARTPGEVRTANHD